MNIILPDEVYGKYSRTKSFVRCLTEDFVFTVDNLEFTILKGFWYDGASIPKVLWSTVGSPFTGNYVIPTLVHDVFYATHFFPRYKADCILYEMNRYCDVGWFKNNSIYYGVRSGGYWAYSGKSEEQIQGAVKHLEVKILQPY